MRTLIFGGDERMISAALYLKDNGTETNIFAIDADILKKYGAERLYTDSYDNYDPIVFPLPFSTDGENINCPFSNMTYKALEVFKNINKKALILAGMAGAFFKNVASEFGLRLKDYYESEQFQISNAVPTAEGAVWTFMNNSRKTVFGSKMCVTGCGKVGKCLADRLNKLGADVTVAARSDKDLAWAESMGMKGGRIDNFLHSDEKYDCIFNTVPFNIFDKDTVQRIDAGTIYIELASKPYGMAKKCADLLGNRYISAPSLPGKTAPVTAGMIIGKTVADILWNGA